MSQFELFFLGPPRIERDGVPITVDTRKAIALLAYLDLTGQRPSRDTLATLLWPDYDQTRARAALRRTLSALKRALGGEGLDVDRENVGLDDGVGWWSDVGAFRSELEACNTHGHTENDVCPNCLVPLTQAVALYRDDFLAGFTLRDSLSFDDWQYFEAEGLARELAGALERLVRGHSSSGEFEQAVTHCRRWLALDTLHESAHRWLMRLYAWSGQRAAALRQYRACVRVLQEELGVPPLQETTELYRAIIAHSELASPAGPRPTARATVTLRGPSTTHSDEVPLVGRTQEWVAMLGAYDAVDANGHFVVLEGEAGIGKTRLAEDFSAYVRGREAAIITARCYEGQTQLAYGPFVEAMQAALTGPDCDARLDDLPAQSLVEAARLVPQLLDLRPGLPSATPLHGPGAQSRFFEGVSQVLLSLCGGAPPVLFLDDLQWADEASLDLLTYIVRRLLGRPVLILGTWRSEEITPTHRLRQLMVEAQRAGTGTLLQLGRLSQKDVLELVHSVPELVGPGDTPLEEYGERLYRESEGLPFFLIEYILALTRSAEPSDVGEWALPDGVRSLLRARLAGISETSWQLLTAGAVVARSFDFDTLRAASGRSENEAVLALEELAARGLVRETGSEGWPREPEYDFGHEKLRTFVYQETSLARRRLLHRRVAEALVERYRGWQESGSRAAQIAYHHQMAGKDKQAAEYFWHAGEHARSLYANAEAIVHFRSAVALGHPEVGALYESVGDLQTLTGDYGAALTSFETAAALCSEEDLIHIEHKLGDVHLRRGELDLAESHFEAGLDQGGNLGECARLNSDWSLAAHRRGRTARARKLAQEALRQAELVDEWPALAQAHNILGVLARHDDDLDQAQAHLEQSLSLAEKMDAPGARVAALNNLALVFGDRGDLARALELTEVALTLCAAQGDRHREAALHSHTADLLHAAGRSQMAMEHLKQAAAIFSEIGEGGGTWEPEIWKLVEW